MPDGEPPYDPLLLQLGRYICTPEAPEVIDVKYVDKSSRLKVALSGVSRFLAGNTKPKLCDYQNVIIFYVGGITLKEVSALEEIFNLAGKNLLVGSTNICTREFLYSSIIKSQ